MGVERGKRLVEQQYRGVSRKRTGESDSLAFAARELADAGTAEVADPEALQEVTDARAVPARRNARCRRTSRWGNSAYS